MIRAVFFDFDGVITDSMRVRDESFYKIFECFSREAVDELIKYHRYNAGLSRFVKIRYFYENILHQSISEDDVQAYARQFSEMMRKELVNKKYLITETVKFIRENLDKKLHIVSGSEGEELRYLCAQLGIADYFVSIEGSPVDKITLVRDRMNTEAYVKECCVLIGDSINDYDAAFTNGIAFYGYNNLALRGYGRYIDSFEDFSLTD